MYTWFLQQLADRLGVAPPNRARRILPHIVFEQPWSQTLFVFTALGSVALIIWLYRREGKVSTASKVVLACLRIAVVFLAMFMLSEAVLSVGRYGFPYLTILIDDSRSDGIADQYDKPEVKAALDALAAASRDDAAGKAADQPSETQTTRLDIAKGLILKDNARLLRELEKQYKVRLYPVSNAGRPPLQDRKTRRHFGCGRNAARAAKPRAPSRAWVTGSARS